MDQPTPSGSALDSALTGSWSRTESDPPPVAEPSELSEPSTQSTSTTSAWSRWSQPAVATPPAGPTPPAATPPRPAATPPPPAEPAPFTAFGPVENVGPASTTYGRAFDANQLVPAPRAHRGHSIGGLLAIGLLSATMASGGTVMALKSMGLLDGTTPVARTSQVDATLTGAPVVLVPVAALAAAASAAAAPGAGGSARQAADSSSAVVIAVEHVSPAVVTIIQSTSTARANPFGGPNPLGGSGRNGGSGNGQSGSGSGSGTFANPSVANPYNLPSGQTATGVGSGVVFDSNGWILTNHHVVEGAEKLTVRLRDGRTFPATVYGIDTLTDLAIVKVDATGLPTASLGTSATLKPGQAVIAIGNPLGEYTNSVTTGVVSGLNRSIGVSGGALDDLIQTDAAINPGNSGGPLLDLAGNVIGINTAEASTAQGIGFAIPVDLATPITTQARAGAKLSRPWLGIRFLAVDTGIAATNGLGVDHGAWISASASDSGGTATAVEAASPAEKAGLRENDVITTVDGTPVDGTHPLVELLAGHEPGSTITLTVQRGSQSLEIHVTLATRPAAAQ